MNLQRKVYTFNKEKQRNLLNSWGTLCVEFQCKKSFTQNVFLHFKTRDGREQDGKNEWILSVI